VSFAARIFWMSGSGAVAVRREWVAVSLLEAGVSAWPQLAQNFASGATAASQRGQLRGGDSTVIEPASYPRIAICYGRGLLISTCTVG